MYEKISERSEGILPFCVIKDANTTQNISKYSIKSLTILRNLFGATTTLPSSLIPLLLQMCVPIFIYMLISEGQYREKSL